MARPPIGQSSMVLGVSTPTRSRASKPYYIRCDRKTKLVPPDAAHVNRFEYRSLTENYQQSLMPRWRESKRRVDCPNGRTNVFLFGRQMLRSGVGHLVLSRHCPTDIIFTVGVV